MKHLNIFILAGLISFTAAGQCDIPVIVANGPTRLSCPSCSVTLSAPPGNTWTPRAAFSGTVREHAVSFSIGNIGYIGTGNSDTGAEKSDFWAYDPATGAWTQKADFAGGARQGASGFSIGTKGYVGTGISTNISIPGGRFTRYNDFWEYDPATNIWRRRARLGGNERAFATGFSIGSKGYIGLGNDYLGVKQDFWQYSPSTDTWLAKRNFGGTARQSAVGFSIGIKGYIGTGDGGGRENNDVLTGLKKDFWEYDPGTDTWTAKRDFGGTARKDATGFSIAGKGYIGTGYAGFLVDHADLKKDFWEYQPSTDTWAPKGDFGGTARSNATGFSIGSKGYIGTGYDYSYENDFWEFDPGYTYIWSPRNETTSSITVRANGDYHVKITNALGCNATSADTRVTVYSTESPKVSASGPTSLCSGGSVTLSAPAGGTWSQKVNSSFGARQSAVSFNIDGIAYIGTGNDGQYKKDFWQYYPQYDIWEQKADFAGGEREGASGFGLGGKGYIGTGRKDSVNYKDFWQYDPAKNNWTRKADFGGNGRFFAVGFSIGNKGYIGTGNDGNYKKNYKNDFWAYDPFTDTWMQKAEVPDSREGATGFSIGNKGYIVFGRSVVTHINGLDTTINTTFYKDFHQYRPDIDKWERIPDFEGTARAFATGFSIGGKGYVCTGNDGSDKKDFWEYDTLSSKWSQRADFDGMASAFGTAFSIGNKGYICAGSAGKNKMDVWQYDPGYSYYHWWPGNQTGASLAVTTTGTYSVTTTDALGCSATSDVTNVTIYPAGIAYVDNSSTTAGDGATWKTAFQELRDALAAARQCSNITAICVAKGTYKPIGNTSRDSAFVILRGGLKLLGGYPSGGGARDVAANPTILSGNLGNLNSTNDNSYHVLVIAGVPAGADSVVVDGFTIQDGQADTYGSTFTYGNTVLGKSYGAGVCIQANGLGQKLALRNLIITRNSAQNVGGGMFVSASSPLLANCTFWSNASSNGGGLRNENGAVPALINCAFAFNTAPAGGGISNDNCSSKIINCVFTGNKASTYGGAILNWNNSSTVITNCTFFNNTGGNGSHLYNYASNPVLTNCILWGNSAGIYNAGSTTTVSYCNVQGGYSGTGNLQTDPAFANAGDPDGADGIYGTADDGLSLKSSSPAVNSGSNTAANLPVTDLTGRPRVINRVDMGAYEYQNPLAIMNSNNRGEVASTVVTEDRQANNSVTVYPVPAKDAVWVNTGKAVVAGSSLVLMDVQGHALQSIRITQEPQRIDVSLLAPGTYLIKLPGGTMSKFIKR